MNIRLLTVISLLLATLQCFGQKDAKARQILDAVAAEYDKAAGTEIVFDGSVKGTIALKGNKFVLDCGGIKSWFDGETLWSYVEDNEEVNVSSPTAEEIQSINPYAMIGMYRNGFNYSYAGTKSRSGMMCKDIVLRPEKKQDIKEITISLNKRMQPVYVKLESNSGDAQEFTVKEYRTLNLADSLFKFDRKKYPNVEIIDLR